MGKRERKRKGVHLLVAHIFLWACILLPSQSISAERVALIIGNQNYHQNGASLQRPVADAYSVAQTLQQFHFDIYKGKVLTDLSKMEFEAEVAGFAEYAKGAKVAIVYYAGHGAQDGYSNYLIPVDAHITNQVDFSYKAVRLKFILDHLKLTAKSPTSLIFLDACRDNPFVDTRGGSSRGLLREATPSEVLVSYSTSQGSVAADNSPYTPALVRSIRSMPNQNIHDVMTEVAARVVHESSRQQPDFSSSLTKYFCFGGCTNFKENQVTVREYSGDSELSLEGVIYQNQKFTPQDKSNYDADILSGRVRTWDGARKYCQALTLGGKKWRLPTEKELLYIRTGKANVNSKGHNYFIKKGFVEAMPSMGGVYNSVTFWGKDEFGDSAISMRVDKQKDGSLWVSKKNVNYVLCVR